MWKRRSLSPGRGGSGIFRRWGMFQPVIERFFRTFKAQVVHGRVFQTIDDFRDAVRAFVLRRNAQWLIERNGHLGPAAARRWLDRNLPCAA